MDELRLDALTSRCVACAKILVEYDRVTAAYAMGDILQMQPDHLFEVGLFDGSVRPMLCHAVCSDPQLRIWNVTPNITHCVRCHIAFQRHDVVHPVFGVIGRATNPSDPTDIGLQLNERIHFVHMDCKDTAKKNSPLILGGLS